jgi:glycogen phosphorylase
VELCLGPVDARGEFTSQLASRMEPAGEQRAGLYRYEGVARACCSSGQYGFTIRVLPSHEDMVGPFLPGLVAWAQPEALQAAAR